MFSELITVTVTKTDAGFNYFVNDLDWKSLRNKWYQKDSMLGCHR